MWIMTDSVTLMNMCVAVLLVAVTATSALSQPYNMSHTEQQQTTEQQQMTEQQQITQQTATSQTENDAVIKSLYYKAALVGGVSGLAMSLVVCIITCCIIFRSRSQLKSFAPDPEYNQLISAQSNSGSMASVMSRSTPSKLRDRLNNTLPSRGSVALDRSESQNDYACMSGGNATPPREVYKRKVSSALQPPKPGAANTKKISHGSLPNLFDIQMQREKVIRQKSADEVIHRQKSVDRPQSARQSTIYMEPDNLSRREERENSHNSGTTFYNSNSIISISTDIYSMSDFTDTNRASCESKRTSSHYTEPSLLMRQSSLRPFRPSSANYVNGEITVNTTLKSAMTNDQILSAKDLSRQRLNRRPSYDEPYESKIRRTSAMGL